MMFGEGNYNGNVIEWPTVGQKTYNCHFFAWHNNQGHEKWSGKKNIWKNGTPDIY